MASTENQETKNDIQPREDIIATAVSFLSNPSVRKAATAQKEEFLRKKGLTNEEIQIAFQRSGVITNNNSLQTCTPVPVPGPYGYYYQTMTPFQRFKDILQTIALFSGIAYTVYYLYKRYIAPYLFGSPKKRDKVEKKLTDLSSTVTNSVAELKTEINKMQSDLERLASNQLDQQSSIRRLGDLKVEIATVKGILLSRHQFPSVVGLGTTSSIPAWQLSASVLKDNENDNDHTNGSSSEIEIQPNSNGGSQNSDSSLEMIKEVEAAEAAVATTSDVATSSLDGK